MTLKNRKFRPAVGVLILAFGTTARNEQVLRVAYSFTWEYECVKLASMNRQPCV